MPTTSKRCNRLECHMVGFHTGACEVPNDLPKAPPEPEFQLTLNRRELASILAGLRLLQWANGPDRKLIPLSVRIDVGRIETEGGTLEEYQPMSDAELRELVRRLT